MKIPKFVKDTFKSKVNLLLLASVILISVLDFITDTDLTGGVLFYGVVLFAHMLFVSFWKDQYQHKGEPGYPEIK